MRSNPAAMSLEPRPAESRPERGRVPARLPESVTGRSGHDPERPKSLGFDVFPGDAETFRPVTPLRTHMAHTAISKSGNRVAFMADDTRRQHFSLRVLEVESGRTPDQRDDS